MPKGHITLTVYFDGENDEEKIAARDAIKAYVKRSGGKYASVNHYALYSMKRQMERDKENKPQ